MLVGISWWEEYWQAGPSEPGPRGMGRTRRSGYLGLPSSRSLHFDILPTREHMSTVVEQGFRTGLTMITSPSGRVSLKVR